MKIKTATQSTQLPSFKFWLKRRDGDETDGMMISFQYFVARMQKGTKIAWSHFWGTSDEACSKSGCKKNTDKFIKGKKKEWICSQKSWRKVHPWWETQCVVFSPLLCLLSLFVFFRLGVLIRLWVWETKLSVSLYKLQTVSSALVLSASLLLLPAAAFAFSYNHQTPRWGTHSPSQSKTQSLSQRMALISLLTLILSYNTVITI